MNTTLALLVILNFAVIGLLPVLFFRRGGRFNLAWFATAAPFFATPLLILLGLFDLLAAPLAVAESLRPLLDFTSLGLAATSIGLIGFTVGAHRIPLALWHQSDDAPVELVTWGPYRRIRHPFYSGFLLAFTAAILAFPHWLILLLSAYGLGVLTLTARREERRLLASEFGQGYADYMQCTGRFLPRLTGTRHA